MYQSQGKGKSTPSDEKADERRERQARGEGTSFSSQMEGWSLSLRSLIRADGDVVVGQGCT